MTKQKIISFFLSLSLFLTSAWAQTQQKELSLEDCILRAIKNNLGLAMEILKPEMASLSVSKAKEKFMPTLAFSFERRNTRSASYSWIEAADQVVTFYNDYSFQLDQAIPTGGTLSVSLDSFKNDTNQKFNTINPVFKSTLSFGISQPLLKDFGFKASRKEILVAQNNREISQNEFKNILLETIYNVEQAYWNLVYGIETLKVREQSLKLARDLLEKNRKEVEIGTLAPKEILSAKAEVAAREADILQAKTQVKDDIDLLKTLINLPDEKGLIEIIPVDKPAFEKREIGLEEALRISAENRPDLASSRIDIKNKELELSYSRNQLLPALNFHAIYWSPGVSGSQILYQDNDPFSGVVIGTIPRGASDALKDALNFKYKNWRVYFTLEIPLNTVLSRAAVAQAKINQDQALNNQRYLEQKAFLEIKMAVRAIETDYNRVQAYKAARELAEEKLAAEEAKLKVGLSTNFVVLQYQRDLANASSAELRASIDYNLSLSRLDKAMGVSLKNRNIQIGDVSDAESRNMSKPLPDGENNLTHSDGLETPKNL